MEIRNLSYSKISSLLRCPRAFRYHYIDQTPIPLNGRMLAGRVYHHTVALAESRKQLFNEVISGEEVADTFSDKWNKELADKLVYDELGEEKVEATVVDFNDDPGRLKDASISLAQLYTETILPKLDIVSIEKRLQCEVDGIPFIGYIDLELAGDIIADHKLRKRRMSEKDVDGDTQLPSYAMLLGKPITGRFYQALDTKEKKIEVAEKVVEQGEIDWVRQLVVDAWQQIQSGIFPCNPFSWTCSPDMCPYYLECRKEWF